MSDGKQMQLVDQDILQLMDEINKEWVEAWRKTIFKSNPKKEKTVTLMQIHAIPT